MLKISLFALVTATATAAPVVHAAPKMAPRVASQCIAKSTLLNFYDSLPGSEFAGFGGKNRRSLLQRKGAIVDASRGFIEIPGSAPGNGDLKKIQISVFGEDLVAVSRIMWPNSGRTGTLRFYHDFADASPPRMRTAADTTFPYTIPKGNSAFLPRRGKSIFIASREDADAPPRYTYKSNYRVGESAFYRDDY